MKFVLISFYGFVDTSFYNCQLSTVNRHELGSELPTLHAQRLQGVPGSRKDTWQKATEGHGRPRKATEGHGRPRKATEGHGCPRKATEGHGCWPRVLKTTWFVENVQYVLNMCKMLQCTYYVHMCIEAERTTQSTVLFREHGEWMWMSVLWMSGDVKTSQAKEAKLQSWVFHSFRLNIEETQEKESKERKTRVSN